MDDKFVGAPLKNVKTSTPLVTTYSINFTLKPFTVMVCEKFYFQSQFKNQWINLVVYYVLANTEYYTVLCSHWGSNTTVSPITVIRVLGIVPNDRIKKHYTNRNYLSSFEPHHWNATKHLVVRLTLKRHLIYVCSYWSWVVSELGGCNSSDLKSSSGVGCVDDTGR